MAMLMLDAVFHDVKAPECAGARIVLHAMSYR